MTEMSMVERVARAIAAVEGYDVDGLKAYAASSSVAKADYEKLQKKALAAIGAMREPTEAVGREAFNHVATDDWLDFLRSYRAMISAALEEENA